MEKDSVEVLVTQQGEAVCGKQGYLLKKSSDVAAFYLDGWVRLVEFIQPALVNLLGWTEKYYRILVLPWKTERMIHP